MKRFFYNAPAFLYTAIVAAAIIYLTLFPHPLPDNDIKWWKHTDKVVHALMFGGFTIACVYDYTRKFRVATVSIKTILKISAISITFGGLIEIAQTVMNIGRSGDWLDFVADIAGIVIFALISKWVISIVIPCRH